MGKNHKHKKRLKAEKSKTQLKNAAKELLKRQNITKTEFKIKPIVVMAQLKTQKTDDGHKNLDIDDVLNRLNHRNESMKIRACQDMETLITSKNLINIVGNFQYVCVFMIEEMPKARRAGLKLLQTMLGAIEEKHCCDFTFQFLVNHLKCAMTIINKRIREDSVLFLDILLKYLPKQMARHFHSFLPDFMMLISSLKNDGELRRTITVNLESKFTSSQWRIAVLSRLHLLLVNVLKRRLDINERRKKIEELSSRYPFRVIYSNGWWENLCLPDDDDIKCENIDSQFGNLFVILYETWLEGQPVHSTNADTCYLSDENAMLFNCVVQSYHILITYLKLTNLLTNLKCSEHEKLIRNLVQHLPYRLFKVPKKTNKVSPLLSQLVITDIKCTNDNIILCYDYLLLFVTNPSKAKAEDICKVSNTLMEYLSRDYSQNTKMNFTDLFLILNHIFIEKARLWCRNKFPVGDVLDCAVNLWRTGNLGEKTKSKLTEILIGIIYEELLENPNLASWFEDLPKVLLEECVEGELFDLILTRMRMVDREQNVSLYRGVLNNYINIYNNLPTLKITNFTELDLKFKKIQVAKYLCYMPEPCPERRKILEELDTTSIYWEKIKDLRTEKDDAS